MGEGGERPPEVRSQVEMAGRASILSSRLAGPGAEVEGRRAGLGEVIIETA